MHFVIMGSGRVGSALATTLDQRGHSVAIVDKNPEAFRRLPKDFSGQRVTGIGFDRDVLTQAGIEDAYAFAAVADGDNSNILAARVARETYGVKRVVARIYDPVRAEVYQRLGIPTVGTVRRTTQSVLSHMLPLDPEVVFVEETGRLNLLKALPNGQWIGRPISQLEEQLEVRLAYYSRVGKVQLPQGKLTIQEGDELYLLCASNRRQEVSRQISRGPEESE